MPWIAIMNFLMLGCSSLIKYWLVLLLTCACVKPNTLCDKHVFYTTCGKITLFQYWLIHDWAELQKTLMCSQAQMGLGTYCIQKQDIKWDSCISKTLRPRQNGRHFADDTFNRIFVNENVRISIKFSLKFVPKGPINNIPALVQIMACRHPGDKPLFEPVMVSLLMHICVTRPHASHMMSWDTNLYVWTISDISTYKTLNWKPAKFPCKNIWTSPWT